MNAMELKTYEILKDKLGEEKALTILQFADDKVEQMINQKKDIFLTKDDKMDLINCTKEDKVDLIKWMVGFWIAQIAAIIGLYFRGH